VDSEPYTTLEPMNEFKKVRMDDSSPMGQGFLKVSN